MNNSEIIISLINSGYVTRKVNTMTLHGEAFHKMAFCDPKTLESLVYYWENDDGDIVREEWLREFAEEKQQLLGEEVKAIAGTIDD